VLALLLFMTGCVPTPERYPVPAQHNPVNGPEKLAYTEYVRAGDPDADSYIIKDIKGLEGTFRWTASNPQLRFYLTKIEQTSFRLELGVHPVTLKDTGPLRLTIFINDHELAQLTYEKAGDTEFDKEVPAAWLLQDADNFVSIRVENPWLAPGDNVYLGFVFRGAGFVQ
jgi:hypothetical protein